MSTPVHVSGELRIDDALGILAIPGLRAAGLSCGVKTTGDPDLGVLVADAPMSAAGVFTRNRCAAAPVQQARRDLEAVPELRTIVVNSGNANALTGARGERDARSMRDQAAAAHGGPALVLSTGVIGEPLPMDRISAGIGRSADRPARDPAAAGAFADAMLTTDTRRKTAVRRIADGRTTPGRRGDGPEDALVVAGVAKGSGMIHPNMGTMLGIVATNAPVPSDELRPMLRRAVDASFNRISVDGDTSTNDAVILLARRPASDDRPPHGRLGAVEEAVTDVCRALAEQIVGDGEGVTRLMELTVSGAESDAAAVRVADSVSRSTLVKTALAGGDPNWGRLMSAVGNAGVDIDPSRCSLRIGGLETFAAGEPRPAPAAALDAAFAADRVRVDVSVGSGPGRARMLMSDLSKRYVAINSEYRT